MCFFFDVMPSVILAILFIGFFPFSLFAVKVVGDDSLTVDYNSPKHHFFIVGNDYYYPDHKDELQAYMNGLNDPCHFKKSKGDILKRAQAGSRQVLEWLFESSDGSSVDTLTWDHSYFKKLWPEKNIHDFFMQDLQEFGVNLEAFEYYLYEIRPEKKLMVSGLKIALQKGWKNYDKYINVMWQIFNDIREDTESFREEWVQTFKELQCLGYMSNIATLEDLNIFPLIDLYK